MLSAREKINSQLQEILDAQTDPWGIEVATVELKHIDLPQEMQRSMAKQAEAERERRAKIINPDLSTCFGRRVTFNLTIDIYKENNLYILFQHIMRKG